MWRAVGLLLFFDAYIKHVPCFFFWCALGVLLGHLDSVSVAYH
jgi:hypothetical protein